MAGKEHSSGPVIQTHSPIFFGFLLVPTLGQRPFTDGRQRLFCGYFVQAWELSSVPSEVISALIRGMDPSHTPFRVSLPIKAGSATSRVILSLCIHHDEPHERRACICQSGLFLSQERCRHLFPIFTRLSPSSAGLAAFRGPSPQPELPGSALPTPESAASHARSFALA
ncbi:hypothetical protein NPIL_516511 [Nephila pilipes]|uniref:Uncharacterized protein n=1 Tax=Nephila pilipes TaxID=299642 RepID=A0A8X6QGR6_NEPPI|nr:hypothetical protein NPIL_516511 [Nephila pilipes]